MLNRTMTTVLLFASLLLVAVAPKVHADPHSFTLHNRTGVDIHKLYVAHHGSGQWEADDDLLEVAVMQNGGELTITLKKSADSWDLRVDNGSGGALEWENVPLNSASDVILEANGVARVK